MELCLEYTNNSGQVLSRAASIDAFSWGSNYLSVPQQPANDVITSASPKNISLSVGQSGIIEYEVAAGRNSTGFVGLGLWPPVMNCRSIPLAVGYPPSQVGPSYFPNYEAGPQSCPVGGIASKIIGYTGASVAYLRSGYRSTLTENVTNISVAAFPTANGGENITFKMRIQTFSFPLTIGQPVGDSSYVRAFTGNPELTPLPENDFCSWYPHNETAVNDMALTTFEKMPSSYMHVNAPALRIGPYSSADYSFSILILGPIARYTAIDVSDVAGTAYFPVSIAGQLQTISGSCDSRLS
jgi:hypothetical protein